MDGYQQKTGYFPDVEKCDQRIYIFANAHEKHSRLLEMMTSRVSTGSAT